MRKKHFKTIAIAVALAIATSIGAQAIPQVATAPAALATSSYPVKIKVKDFRSECITDFEKIDDNGKTPSPVFHNLHRNKIEIESSKFKQKNLKNGSVLILDRMLGSDKHQCAAIIKFSDVTSKGCKYEVIYKEFSKDAFNRPAGFSGHLTFSTKGKNKGKNKNYVNFAHLTLEDAFCVSVDKQSSNYTYVLRFNPSPDSNEEKFLNTFDKSKQISNEEKVPVYFPLLVQVQYDAKFTPEQVEADTDHHLPYNEDMNLCMNMYSGNPVLQYDIYRVTRPLSAVKKKYEILKVAEIKRGKDTYTVSVLDDDGKMKVLSTEPLYARMTIARFYDKTLPKTEDLDICYNTVAHVDCANGKGTYGIDPTDLFTTGKIDAKMAKVQRSAYYWLKDGKKYCYYTTSLDALLSDKKHKGFISPYKVRVWRECETPEVLDEAIDSRKSRIGASILFEEQDNAEIETFLQVHGRDVYGESLLQEYKQKKILPVRLGEKPAPFSDAEAEEKTGTFGARMVDANSDFKRFTCKFRIRAYYKEITPASVGSRNSIRPKMGDSKVFRMIEYIFPYTFSDNIATGIDGTVESKKAVKSVTFHNLAGMASSVPFDGMNIVVTTFSDGTTATQKIMK